MTAIKKTELLNITTEVKLNEDGSAEVSVKMTPEVILMLRKDSEITEANLKTLILVQAKSELLLQTFSGIKTCDQFFQRVFANYVSDASNIEYVFNNMEAKQEEVH